MKFTIKLAVLVLFAVSTLTSCVSNKKYEELLGEKEALAKSLAETQESLKMLEEEKDQLMAEKDNLANEVESMKADLEATKDQIDQVKQMIAAKEAEIAKIKGDVENAFAPYVKAGLTIEEQDDMIYVSMPEKVLFRSGSANLDNDDKEVIGKLADILKADPSLSVIVEGHTDAKKMVQGAAYSDNWDLSVARSVAVVRQLVKMGVSPEQVTAAGSGEHMPAVTENPDSSETLQANRRTEFIIVPNIDALFDYYKG